MQKAGEKLRVCIANYNEIAARLVERMSQISGFVASVFGPTYVVRPHFFGENAYCFSVAVVQNINRCFDTLAPRQILSGGDGRSEDVRAFIQGGNKDVDASLLPVVRDAALDFIPGFSWRVLLLPDVVKKQA